MNRKSCLARILADHVSVSTYKSNVILRLLLALIIAIGSSMAHVNQVLALDSGVAKGCNDVQFIFARGSGEPLRGSSEAAWRTAILSKLSPSSLRYSFYELGSSEQDGYQYPAVAVSDSFDGGLNLIGAAISGGKAFNYGASVRTGIGELKAYVKKISTACPNTKFVLGGYSQGGQVVSTTLPELDADKVIYAATFGDPKIYLPEGKGLIPAACLGRGYSNYRVHVPNCRAYEGILGGTNPYQAKTYIDKLGVWCNKDDIMCSGYFDVAAHTAYVANGLYDDAATIISQKVSAAYPGADIFAWWHPGAIIKDDVAFLIDTTGSMQTLVAQYSEEAKNLASKVIARGGRIALYEYRDLDDPFEPRQVCGFGCSYDEFVEKLDSLQVDGGGDTAESVLSGMKYLMNTLNWRTGATKSLVLLTDANYHNPDRDGTLTQDVVNLSLAIDPVNIYVITQSGTMSDYAELARLTGGAVFNANDSVGLTQSTDTILQRPIVSLPLAEYSGMVGDTFTFTADAINVDGDSTLLVYDWDLNGDGDFEYENAGAILEHSYQSEFSGTIQVKVTNADGLSSTMSAQVEVYDKAPENAKIDWLAASPILGSQSTVSFSTTAERVLVVINDALYGWLASDQKSFVIKDLSNTDVTVTLIPYDINGRRGESASIVVSDRLPLAPNTGVVSQGYGRELRCQ